MKKEFVSYELAVKLKELGFDEPCFAWDNGYKEIRYENDYGYRNYTPLPLWQQAFDWCLLNGKLDGWVYIRQDLDGFSLLFIIDGYAKSVVEDVTREECLEKLIELIENEKNNK